MFRHNLGCWGTRDSGMLVEGGHPAAGHQAGAVVSRGRLPLSNVPSDWGSSHSVALLLLCAKCLKLLSVT